MDAAYAIYPVGTQPYAITRTTVCLRTRTGDKDMKLIDFNGEEVEAVPGMVVTSVLHGVGEIIEVEELCAKAALPFTGKEKVPYVFFDGGYLNKGDYARCLYAGELVAGAALRPLPLKQYLLTSATTGLVIATPPFSNKEAALAWATETYGDTYTEDVQPIGRGPKYENYWKIHASTEDATYVVPV